MGRRNRSSSIGNTKEAARPRSYSYSTSTPGVDIDACVILFNHFLHDKDHIGRTFLHQSIHAVTSDNDQQSDGYYLMDAICKRAKELDRVVKEKGRGAAVTHLHKLMLTKDDENGYTPLHYAIIQRDLTSLLLLLKHASGEIDSDTGVGLYSQQMQHPLRLLGCRGDDEGIPRVMKDLATSLDNEALSPLELLGATSANELEKCRQTMHWSYLKQVWKKLTQTDSASDRGDDNNPRMRRQRMISFGDERDYLNNDVGDAPVRDDLGRGSRSGSFRVHDIDHEDDEDDAPIGVNNDLLPLGDVDFTLLVESVAPQSHIEDEILTIGDGSVDYGCELYTFGRADHAALGVPQFGAAGKRDKQFGDVIGKEGSNDSVSHRPRRVEAFALGDLRREWSDPKASASKDKDAVDSPVVAVAAAAHHTLAITRGGRLFAFGLGKGGRLGTGDENHRPLPTRILGPLAKRIVTSIAAAENHSLCATAFDGACYAWGSNGFGQLGMPSDQDSRLSPRRVDDLKPVCVVSVAAGDRHSVVLTKSGDVYCWGDNKSAQCAISTASPSCHRPTRVDALAERTCIAISASEFSTLVLTRPPTYAEDSLASLPVNAVYGWGHGNHNPLKVTFTSSGDRSSRSTCVNPISISSAKFHSVALSADGRVYTWGVSSGSLGLDKACNQDGDWSTPKQKGQSTIAPQLVVGMLPEKGGGHAVAVSASSEHTAVITSSGHLYTWGSAYGNSTLGHKGVKWQPSPRKVKRVHRAVGLAAAKEHTVLLIGTSFPSLPNASSSLQAATYKPLSLKEAAAVSICRNVDTSNVIPIACVAQRLNSRPLTAYCQKFIQLNLDGVFDKGSLSDMECLLNNKMALLSSSNAHENYDSTFHPFLYMVANSDDWMRSSPQTLKSLKGCLEKKKKTKKSSSSESNEGNRRMDQEILYDNVKTKHRLHQDQKVDELTVSNKVDENVSKANSRGASKFYCDVCAASCPDSASYTLHIGGRKHRNRLNHAREEEEREVAKKMMNMKRMQLMNISEKSSDVDAGKHKPYLPAEKLSAWAPQPTNKPRSNSLLGIMNEELKNSPSISVSTPKLKAGRRSSTSTPASGKKLSFTPQPDQASWHVSTTPNSSFSLEAFIPLHDRTPPNKLKSSNAVWATPKPMNKSVPAFPSQNNVKSFADIQKEELDNKQREDHMCHIGDNKWFVQQRDRAASIGEIQQREQEEAEWLLLVEEQKRIEEDIARERKIKAKKEKAKTQRRQQKKSCGKKQAKPAVGKQECT